VSLGLAVSFGQTDEIQVYDASIAAPGVFNLTWHNNFTPEGREQPAFPGGIIPDKSLNGTLETALGVTDWFEAGLYFPVYSISKRRGASLDAVKLRTLFVVPHAADRSFFYGVNFEFSYNATYWDQSRWTSEIRPILGYRWKRFDFIVNPILDSSYKGVKNLEFAPAGRLAWNIDPRWSVAAEEYADLGSLRDFRAANHQSHQLFGVVDCRTKLVNIEFGAGFGLTSESDKVILKLILSRDLN